MRLTYTDLKNSFLDNIGQSGSTDTALVNFFNRHLSVRYQLALATIQNYKTQPLPQTTTTTAGQQYYHYPPGVTQLESVKITVGGVVYPLQVLDSQKVWDQLNKVSFTSIPTIVFPRRDDFGLWPKPPATYTITFEFFSRHKDLRREDYTTGTVTVAQNSATVTGTGTTFTTAMVERWFRLTPDGQWYRIKAVNSATSLELETVFEEVGASGQNYVIGETPELPEETHIYLAAGVTADYYAGPRRDKVEAQAWENFFWTGDRGNPQRSLEAVFGGILGARKKYAQRADSRFVYRRTADFDKIWATSIS